MEGISQVVYRSEILTILLNSRPCEKQFDLNAMYMRRLNGQQTTEYENRSFEGNLKNQSN